ncbi:MAG TPA: hypothetical protein VK504_00345 [Vicinamibacterales bacterium]|nr:hypothetical protein [Vicinamibacterales bacterium]
MRVRLVAGEESLREHRSKTAATDDNQIEWARIDPLRARERFVQTVADKSAQHIATEIRGLRDWAGHTSPPAGSPNLDLAEGDVNRLVSFATAELPFRPLDYACTRVTIEDLLHDFQVNLALRIVIVLSPSIAVAAVLGLVLA